MAEYYRTVFSIRKPDVRGIALLREARTTVRDWAMECFGQGEYDGPRREWIGANGALRIRKRELPDEGIAAFRLVWTRPDASDQTNRWRLSVRLATEGNDVEADFEALGIETPNRPLREEYLAKLPAIPRKLLDDFECLIGAARLTTTATQIARDESSAFISDSLLSRDRQMPLVVVSRDKAGEGIDADRLQEQLVGLADVVAYDHDTAWDIAKDVPRALRCYDGAIRLYAPGCSEDDVPQQNPYWMPSDEERMREYPNRFWMMLRDECVNRTPTHSRRRLYSAVRNRIRQIESDQRDAKIERLEERQTNLYLDDRRRREIEASPQSSHDLEAEYDLRFEELDSAYDEILMVVDGDERYVASLKRVARSLKNGNDRLRGEVKQLEREIAGLKSGVGWATPSELTAQIEESAEAEVSPIESAESEFRTVLEAVESAKIDLSRLRFLSSAFESARESQYQRPQDVYRALKILDACGNERSEGPLGVSVHEWMAGHSVEYAAHESEQTEIRHGAARKFYDPARDFDVYMPEHIKIGRNQLRIHFCWHEDQWAIGWVGDHLPTAGYNS